MNRRLEKRHKRKVSRARARVKIQEPDLRTPEQILAAREASRPDAARAPGQPEWVRLQQAPGRLKRADGADREG